MSSRRSSRASLTAGISAAAMAAVLLTAGPADAVVGPAAQDGSFPSTVKLDIGDGKRSCTATLVDELWLVTAASCFADDPAQYAQLTAGAPKLKTTATVGRADLSRTDGGAVTTVEQLVPRGDRDLVMARLAQPVTGVSPAGVPAGKLSQNEDVSVSGFGRTKDEWVPDRLHYGRFTARSVAGTTIDLVGKDDAAAVCEGDAGAPVWRESGGRYELVGVNNRSWFKGCFGHEDETRDGAVASRADDIADWIQTVRLTTKVPDVSNVIASADFDGDGRTDIAAVLNDGNLHAFYAKPDGTLRYGRELWAHDGTWKNYTQIIGGDFNGDGKADLIALRGDGQLFLHTGSGDGLLNPRRPLWHDTSWGTMKQIVRYRSDSSGRDGLAAVWGDGSLHAYTTNPDGTLVNAKRDLWPDKTWDGMKRMASGDFNGDGRDDIAAIAYDGALRLYTGNAQGTVTRAADLWHDKTWGYMRSVLGGDFNGDGKTDIAAHRANGDLRLYTGNGTGPLTSGPLMWSATTS
ncbi:FG-GAP-like repeat-containing protein [Streptomyces chrestomyceticus]|uniref:FG-GAP-like repeat-containing protein n=1 Tax=Streptomyces chrestomyceticus TaxID=68185 RepID=UPI0019D19596|nr:FG-GAP-like repeat-containing protein [Streptomyces chrestomyceticus]